MIEYFSQQEIEEYSFPAIIEHAKELVACGRVVELCSLEDTIIGSVDDGKIFKTVIERKNGKLEFSCNCEHFHPGACVHAVAIMMATKKIEAIQIGIKWGEYNKEKEESLQNIVDYKKEKIPSKIPEIEEVYSEKPILRLYLSEQESMLLVETRFAYFNGKIEFKRSDPSLERIITDNEGKLLRIHRSKARETTLLSTLKHYDLVQYQTGYYTPTIEPRIWILQVLPLLAQEGYEIYGQEKLKSTQSRKSKPRLKVSIKSAGNSFFCSISLSFDGISATLASLVKAAKEKEKFILLSDGTSGILPQNWIETFAALFSEATEILENENCIKVNNTYIGLVEELYNLADEHSADDFFKEKRELLHNFKGVAKQKIPSTLKAELRAYQQAGFEWFYFLKEFNFGGCLADDMGLGKTIQSLALLTKEKELGEGQPSLVVVPNTLLFNWQRECKKFSPNLNMLLYHGPTRHNYLRILGMADVILTTYGTLVRDIDKLKQIYFHYIILDEAHIIKNPLSQVSKAVRSLKSKYRLALTGTPIENNLSELWSIFTFLNPGMLGSFKSFFKNFIKPIENEFNENAMHTLRKLIYPFILRRTKSQVVKDLPPKNEIILYAEMLPKQFTLYKMTKEIYYSKIKNIIDKKEIELPRIQILEGLLRLRQICCHPQLFDKNYTDDSGKFQLIESMLINATAEKHKSLVFSQFTSALRLLQNRLACIGINSEILTGETPNRQKVVDNFQSKDGPPVFLISLKAGGVGLNLTAADYVFHLDPWWNPAAESQATDRAYRIGQTKPVFIYKLITKDSIEERVLELQEKKRLLMNGIIREEENFFKNLTQEDILSLFE